MAFTQLGLSEPIVQGVRALGFSEPTPIQRRAIPLILTGRDLVGSAQTGTGKTAAFVLPILMRLAVQGEGLRALVLVPTRELAAQVETHARACARFTRVRTGVVFGGVPIGPQERLLRQTGIDLLIATPGRLLDLYQRQSVSFEEIQVVVLDEADRMVDMGFAPDVRRILRFLPRARQTLMFSATMPTQLNQVASGAFASPTRVEIAGPTRTADGITQSVVTVRRDLKSALLGHLLGRAAAKKALVFSRSKRGADRLAATLRRSGLEVAALHGDRSQSQRERALLDFRRGRVMTLIATDLASRGLDVQDVTHVINYDVPRAAQDYVHRIGRTGRMHAEGEAITLVCAEDRDYLLDIERVLGRMIPRMTVKGFDAEAPLVVAAAHDSRRDAKGRVSAPSGPAGRRPATRRDQDATRSHRAGASAPTTPAAPAVVASPIPAHGRRPRLAALDRRSRKRM